MPDMPERAVLDHREVSGMPVGSPRVRQAQPRSVPPVGNPSVAGRVMALPTTPGDRTLTTPICEDHLVARTWLSIRVDLVDGGGRTLWPRPGRVFAAARSHSFAQLATAIDDAFARWDRAHLHMFDLGGGAGLLIDRYWDDPPDNSRVDDTVKLGTLTGGQQFVYVFDLGDDWAHLCTLSPERIDPLHTVGITPDRPMPYWGWGVIPDQYGRAWDGDDGETRPPPDPQLADLPALHPGWGPRHR